MFQIRPGTWVSSWKRDRVPWACHCTAIGSDRVELPAEQKLHTHVSDKLKENRHDKGSSLADMVVSCGKFKT